MQDMLLTGNGTQSSLSEYRDTVSELISLGVSRDLNRACRRLVSVQDRVIDSVAKVGLLTEKAIATVDAKLAADARGLSGTVQSTGGSSA
jgi:hypothetical protein